jgi:hypothetical protein
MRNVKPRTPGRHFLQIPGPTSVPDRILRAMDMPILDHRGPEFQTLARRELEGLKDIFKTKSSVFVFPASGTAGSLGPTGASPLLRSLKSGQLRLSTTIGP